MLRRFGRIVGNVVFWVVFAVVCWVLVWAVFAFVRNTWNAPADQSSDNLACVHFMNVLEDLQAGRLYKGEALAKLEELVSMSVVRDDLAKPATLMLVSAEAGNWDGVFFWAEDMVIACEKLDWSR